MGWSTTLTRLRAGEVEARDRVVRLIIGTLRRLRAYELRASWDDVVQDVLITLLDTNPRSTDDRSVAAWIRRVAMHTYLDRIRKERGRRRSGEAPGVGWRQNVPLDDVTIPDDEEFDRSERDDLARALMGLPPRLRAILECKYALGCTDAEGAERLGEALGTYKRLLRKALAELRDALIDGRPNDEADGTFESKSDAVPSREV